MVPLRRRRQSRLREKRRARWKPTTRKRDGTCRATDDEDKDDTNEERDKTFYGYIYTYWYVTLVKSTTSPYMEFTDPERE